MLTSPIITELIAINYAKRELKRLPDEWYHLDEMVCNLGRFDLIPSKEQIAEAKRVLTCQ